MCILLFKNIQLSSSLIFLQQTGIKSYFLKGFVSNPIANLTFLDSIHNMDSETPFTALAPLVFKGKNYKLWAARMKAHLEANDL